MPQQIIVCLGKLFSALYPRRRKQLEDGFTIPAFIEAGHSGFVDRCIRKSILDVQVMNGGSVNTESLHQRFWKAQKPSQWFDQTADRLESIHKPIVEPHFLKIIPQIQAMEVQTVVELGCGNGAWLAHLKTILPESARYIGIDISSEQIIQNREKYPKLEFFSGDLLEWVNQNPMEHVLYLTNCGVLEYLSQSSVENLYRTLIEMGNNNLLFLVEPIAVSMDLERQHDSILFGDEFSYSHHHPGLLRQSGFDVTYQQSVEVDGYRLLMIAAKPAA